MVLSMNLEKTRMVCRSHKKVGRLVGFITLALPTL